MTTAERWWLEDRPPVNAPDLYGEAWIRHEAANNLALKNRLYRAGKGCGVVFNGDTAGAARRFADRQNQRITEALSHASPIERAVAYWRTNFTQPYDVIWWMRNVEGMGRHTDTAKIFGEDLRRIAPDWFDAARVKREA